MKKSRIITTIFFIFCLIIISTNVFAAVSDFTGETNPEGSSTIITVISAVLAVVRTIGIGVAIIILMVIGSKYMLASAGERAEIKKYAITYIIGAIVLFASSGIINIIKNFVDTNIK